MEDIKSGKIQLLSQPHFTFRQEVPLLNCLTFSLLTSSVPLWSPLNPLSGLWTAQLFPLPLTCAEFRWTRILQVPLGSISQEFKLLLIVLVLQSSTRRGGKKGALSPGWRLPGSCLFVCSPWLALAEPKLLCSQEQVPPFSQGIVRTQLKILTQAVEQHVKWTTHSPQGQQHSSIQCLWKFFIFFFSSFLPSPMKQTHFCQEPQFHSFTQFITCLFFCCLG